ncbi:MAG: VCBS repeat-containing protein [Rhodothermales bacterium]
MISTRPIRSLSLYFGLFCVLVSACDTSPPPPSGGEALARTYCGSCHVYPEPALLSVWNWGNVLPDMGSRLGVYPVIPRDTLVRLIDWAGVDPASIYPEEARLTRAQWDSLEAFYLEHAPDTLLTPARGTPVAVEMPAPFVLRAPDYRFDKPFTILTRIQASPPLFYVGNYGRPNSTLMVINGKGQVLFDWKIDGAPVDVHWDGQRLYVLLVGLGPEPTEAALGSIYVLTGPSRPPVAFIEGLKRPVDMAVADLSGDGLDDFVIGEFGHQVGSLVWYESNREGAMTRHVLSEMPGAAHVEIADMDGDGRQDIVALMAQGDEGIDIYHNAGGGRYEAKRVLRFPPVYGSNSFQLADVNGDGRTDILYVNGDNADATHVPKPYHGLRLFLANAAGGYDERWFFPMHGAIAARIGDFDADGDLDIAAISAFPDYLNAPGESFIYLRNRGDLTFEASTFPDAQRGRWLTMDAGDYDADGDIDLILGSNIGFAPEGDTTGLFDRWQEEAPSFLMLHNSLDPPAPGNK